MTSSTDTPEMALFAAAASGDATLVETLVGAGANIAARDEVGWTALWHAARNGHARVVDLLLAENERLVADDADGALILDENALTEALDAAAERSHRAIAEALIDGGIDDAFYSTESSQRCRVCYRRVCVGENEVCAHYVCARESGEFVWFRDPGNNFDEEVRGLASRLEGRAENDRIWKKIAKAPPEIAEVLSNVASVGPTYWCDGRASYTTGGMLSSYVEVFFSENADCAERIKREAGAALAWLEAHVRRDA